MPTDEVVFALEETRWALLCEAAEVGPFYATSCLRIAQTRVGFTGTNNTARSHATKLEEADLLEVLERSPHIRYGLSPKGRNLYAHLLALANGIELPLRPEPPPRLVAVVARADESEIDFLLAEPGSNYELVAELRRSLTSSLRRYATIRVDPSNT